MPVKNYYNADREYGQKRLNGTIMSLLNKEELFTVSNVHHLRDLTGKIQADFIKKDKSLTPMDLIFEARSDFFGIEPTYISGKEVDFEPIRLGYCWVHSKENACYFYKNPRRIYLQGLNIKELIGTKSGYYKYIAIKDLMMPAFNKYPSIQEAMKKCSDSKNTDTFMVYCPFSRDFAVNKEGVIEFRGEVSVGELKKFGNSFKAELVKEFFYLQDFVDYEVKNAKSE